MSYAKECLEFLRSDRWPEWSSFQTDQRLGKPHPPLEKPVPQGAKRIDLPAPETLKLGQMPLVEAIRRRRSRRKFSATPLTLDELSFLLWATQGVQEIDKKGIWARHTVPSGGSRHPFEAYLAVHNVTGLEKGLYRYLPFKHQLVLLRTAEDLDDLLASCANGQVFVGQCAVTWIWTAIPYRTQWRYAMMAPKIIAQDSGHLAQNLYLAVESIGGGTCGIGAYDQSQADAIVDVDGEEEFVIYMAPVGKVDE